jgi:hypothetical protein
MGLGGLKPEAGVAAGDEGGSAAGRPDLHYRPHAYQDPDDLRWASMGYGFPELSAFDLRWASAGFGGIWHRF